MKLEEVNLIQETKDINLVNTLLKQGYSVLRIFHQHSETQDGSQSNALYVLGKVKKE